MGEQSKGDEHMCVDVNVDVFIVDEANEYWMDNLEALVLHEERILGESEKATVYICTPKQGYVLRQDDSDEEYVDEGLIGSLKDYLEN